MNFRCDTARTTSTRCTLTGLFAGCRPQRCGEIRTLGIRPARSGFPGITHRSPLITWNPSVVAVQISRSGNLQKLDLHLALQSAGRFLLPNFPDLPKLTWIGMAIWLKKLEELWNFPVSFPRKSPDRIYSVLRETISGASLRRSGRD